ncbi:ammonium transporter [Kiloniella sp.]|uniref:ammonium transporter n=1 Tax=Kiloniella sp. TaxID=1938587 RepID=UPI003B026BB1
MEASVADTFWIIICSLFVFLMQPGFTALETGFTRSKNAINVAMKNLCDFLLSSLIFWVIGFGLMFGATYQGFWGTSNFFNNWQNENLDQVAFFIFQTAFCATAATLTSGAIAERMRFKSFLYMIILLAAVVYPVFGHWAWNVSGWLNTQGFYDFAGSTVVHSLAGWVALAAVILVGPRIGRFNENGSPRHIPGSNISVSALGFLLIWVGWLGFNGGSVGKFSPDVGLIIINTIIGGAAGGATIIAYFHGYKRQIITPDLLINGALAGLVAVTASANVISPFSACLIGAMAAIAMLGCHWLLLKKQIDDAIGVIPVHLAGGILGTLCVPFFADPELASGIPSLNVSIFEQVIVQFMGIVVCGLWAFGITYSVLYLINRVSPLRVDIRGEIKGLNVVEHGATTEILDFLNSLDEIEKSTDLSVRVPVEPFTEIGQIAEKYNVVMSRLQNTSAKTDSIIRSLPVSIITFTRDTLKITSLNPTAINLFGYPEDSLVGRTITSLFDIPHQSQNLTIEQLLIEGKSKSGLELVVRCADSVQRVVRVSVSETGTSEGVFYSAVVIDITEQEKEDRDKYYKISS